MGRFAVARACCFAALLILSPVPAQAAGPLALLGKHILKQIVKDFFESQLTSLARESLGPCKSMLADTGVGAVGAIRGLASGGVAGAVQGLAPGAGIPGTGAQAMDPAMRAQMAQMMPGMLDAQAMQGMDPAMRAQVMQMMAGMPGVQAAAPLSGEEVDELVNRLVTLSKAMPDHELPCSPQELKLVFGMSSSMPMGAGPLRMMLEQFREMDSRFKETRESFARMSAAEQEEAIDVMLAEAASLGVEERKQLAAFLQSDLFGLPATVRERLGARLASLR